MIFQKLMRAVPAMLCLGLLTICGMAQPAGAADSYTIQVSPTVGELDVIAVKGTVMIRAKVLRNGLPAPHGTVVNWTFDGSVLWSHKDEAVNLKPISTIVTGDNGETIYPFMPKKQGLQDGAAGSVKITGTVAGTNVSSSVDKIAVGFGSFIPDHKIKWVGVEGATGHCGEVKRGTAGSKYLMDTCLPTVKQLQAVSGANRPASVRTARYWSGQSGIGQIGTRLVEPAKAEPGKAGAGKAKASKAETGKSTGAFVVDLGDGKDLLSNADRDANPAVCLR